MIKPTTLLSVALVTIMALTVVSGAGVITAQASIPPVLSPMVAMQDGKEVDPSALQVGKEVTVQWTYIWQDPAPVQQGSAWLLFTEASKPAGSTVWPLKSTTVMDQDHDYWFDVGDGYAMRLTFTPDREGTYAYHVTLHAQIVEFEQTLETDVSLVARSPSAATSFVTVHNRDGVDGDPYTYSGIPFEVYHAIYDNAVLSTKDDLSLRSVDLSRYGPVTRVHMLQTAGNSQDYPDDYVAGTVTVYYTDGTTSSLDLKLGRNTAEWAYDRPGLTIAHTKITPAYSWETTEGSATPYNGHYFYASIDTGGKPIDHIGISAPQADPNAHVFALTLERSNAQTHAVDTATALIKDNAIAFDKPTSHTPFDSKLAEMIGYINVGDYATALGKVQHDLIPKADGNARPADWVTATSQPDVYAKLKVIESDLLSLLS